MKFEVKAFQVQQYVPGLGSGTYAIGKADIYRMEQVEQGVVVFRGRGGVDTHPATLITWPLIKWAHVEEVVEKTASKKKASNG
jgi:hypothetical protein